MSVDLTRREVRAVELMDDPACDLAALHRTYDDFALVNRLVAGWRTVYRTKVRPELSADRTTSILDIGSGGGDVPRALAAWAAQDGLPIEITAIDPDPRAHDYATSRPATHGLGFARASSADLVAEGRTFDLVLSNHVLHHLSARDLGDLLADSERLATKLVVHNDIARGRLAYGAYAIATTGTFRGSFIHPDGLMSIRRSYRAAELEAAVPLGWNVERQWPFRLLLTHRPAEVTRA